MRLRPARLLVLLACAPLPAARVTQAPLQPKQTIVFLGDSLTAGLGLAAEQAYPALIQRRLDSEGRPARVVNAGVSGDTTAGGAARLDWIYRQRIDVLVVALGANDGLRGIPLASTERNLRSILDRAKREKSRVLLVGMQLPENYGPVYRRQFQAIYPRLAKAYRVALLPFLLEGVALRPELNQADGIHPNAKGAAKVSETVWKALAPVLEGK
ncbi:MAG TPA: arylesterase [Holophagaceae bacterium]|nr:arylesterase [Holophagaceae bacterium]